MNSWRRWLRPHASLDPTYFLMLGKQRLQMSRASPGPSFQGAINAKPAIRQVLLSRQRELGITTKEINKRLGVKSNGGGMWCLTSKHLTTLKVSCFNLKWD
jgi:hypothetical protein